MSAPPSPMTEFSIPTSTESEQRLLFDRCAEFGYGGLQLKAGQYTPYLDEPKRFLSEWNSNVRLSLIFWGPLDNPGRERLRQVIEFARGIGAKRVVFCHAHGRAGLSSADIAGFGRTISEIGKSAADLGVTLSLHNHFDQPVMYREDIAAFFSAATPGAVGLTIDTAHLVKSGVRDLAGTIREFGGIIDNVHLKDLADNEFRSLGCGEIEFGLIFTALKEIGYQGPLCADEESGAGVVSGMAVASEFIGQHWPSN